VLVSFPVAHTHQTCAPPGVRDRGRQRDREVAKAAWCSKEAVDGVEVDGSRGMRRDLSLGERGGALQDAIGHGEAARQVQA